MRSLVALTLAAVAALALACGSGAASRSTVVAEAPCTNDATAAAVQATSSAALASETDIAGAFRMPDTEIECRLRPALLRADELPGWQAGQLEPIDGHLQSGEQNGPFDPLATCGAPANTFIDGLSAEFERVDARSLLAEQVVAFAPGNAARFMQGLRRNCALKLAAASPDNNDATYAPAPATSFGDESLAVKLSMDFSAGESPDQPVPEDVMFIRRGDVVAAVELVYPQTSGTSIQAIAARVDQALATVRPIPEPTTEPGTGCVPTPTPSAAGNDSRLRAALLRLQDMPESWAPHLVSKCGLIDGEGACKGAGTQHERPVAVVSTVFDSPDSFLREDIEEWHAGTAAAELRRLQDRFRVPYQCDATLGSTHFKWEVALVALPSLPDGALAIRQRTIGLGNGSSTGSEIIIYIVLLRHNDLIARLTYFPPRSAQLGLFSGAGGIDPETEQILTERLVPIVPIAQRKLVAVATQ